MSQDISQLSCSSEVPLSLNSWLFIPLPIPMVHIRGLPRPSDSVYWQPTTQQQAINVHFATLAVTDGLADTTDMFSSNPLQHYRGCPQQTLISTPLALHPLPDGRSVRDALPLVQSRGGFPGPLTAHVLFFHWRHRNALTRPVGLDHRPVRPP